MNIIRGKKVIDNIMGYDVILYPMSIYNSMNKGLAYDIALNFPEVKISENKTKYGDNNKYGTVRVIKSNNILFACCYCHNGGFNKEQDGSFINYEYLKQCLTLIKNHFINKNVKICSPLIGYSDFDGNGNEEKLMTIHKTYLNELNVDLYIDKIIDFKTECYFKIKDLSKKRKNKEINNDEYNKLRGEIEWKKKNGIFVKMPDDFIFEYKKKGSEQKYTIKKLKEND